MSGSHGVTDCMISSFQSETSKVKGALERERGVVWRWELEAPVRWLFQHWDWRGWRTQKQSQVLFIFQSALRVTFSAVEAPFSVPSKSEDEVLCS